MSSLPGKHFVSSVTRFLSQRETRGHGATKNGSLSNNNTTNDHNNYCHMSVALVEDQRLTRQIRRLDSSSQICLVTNSPIIKQQQQQQQQH